MHKALYDYMKLTKNFSFNEFKCSCGCDMPEDVYWNILRLATRLQILRNFTGQSISINSAYRCEDHNASIGGVKSSQHILGNAADIVIKRQNPKETRKVIEKLINEGVLDIKGIGSYETFTHVDIRKNKARW